MDVLRTRARAAMDGRGAVARQTSCGSVEVTQDDGGGTPPGDGGIGGGVLLGVGALLLVLLVGSSY